MISTDELVQALRALKPDQVAALLGEEHRSPLRERQLHDLTLKPSKDDPRPTFFQESDGREFLPIRHLPYPKLLWNKDTGQEITVKNLREEKELGWPWMDTPPRTEPMDPEAYAKKLFEGLSAEDQAFILEHQRQLRLEKVKAAMGILSEKQTANVFGVVAKGNGKK
jgi:hypothetical protein